MTNSISIVDAFTQWPFKGNPAAVCLLDEFPADGALQRLAAEMNLSETAFLVPRGDRYQLRWFTPAVEVELCGHATLASAHVLWETGRLNPAQPAIFETRSGVLKAHREGELIVLDFPSTPVTPVSAAPELIQAIPAELNYVGQSRFDYLVAVASESIVRSLSVDIALLKPMGVRGVIVTAPGDGKPFDFVSRYFAPGCGIDEDPVTGSAHCALAPFWHERTGKTEFQAFQASSRGGRLQVRLVGDRVHLGGRAITICRGELLIELNDAMHGAGS